MSDSRRFQTLCVHGGQKLDPAYGAVMPPIYQSSTYAFKGVNKPGEFDYSRSGNPTRQALERALAALEGGSHGYAFATGMGAEATVLALLKAGEHVLVHDDLYGGTYRLLTGIVANHGVQISFVNMRDLSAVRSAIQPNTRMIWVETPTNPLMNLVDLAAIAEIARQSKVLTVCDNTFLSPVFQNPLALGFDIVVHSVTKYLNGHSDVVGGAVVVNNAELGQRIYFHQNGMGTPLGPMDCYLCLRGIKTLPLRMAAHNHNALTLARWLEEHPKIGQVLHPGLESHPQHALALKQATGHGGTFSFRVKGGQKEAFALLQNIELFTLAESLGGVESLIEHPCTMTHMSMPKDVRDKVGITEDLIRISVGIENVEDLIAAMDKGLSHV
jgi:cystathionine gamma-lyase